MTDIAGFSKFTMLRCNNVLVLMVMMVIMIIILSIQSFEFAITLRIFIILCSIAKDVADCLCDYAVLPTILCHHY